MHGTSKEVPVLVWEVFWLAGVPDYSKHANEIADDITKLAAEDIEAEILEG